MKKSVCKDFEFLLNCPFFFSANSLKTIQKIISQEECSHFQTKLPEGASHAPWSCSAIDPDHWQSLKRRFLEKSEESGFWTRAQNHIDAIQSGRLGIRYEGMVQFFLDQALGPSNVFFHVPVRQKNSVGVQTWGEMDVVFRDSEFPGIVFHWELSAKFYLCLDLGLPMFRWRDCVGPSAVDRLDLKGPKMFLQQMALSKTAMGRACIPFISEVEEVRSQAFTQGILFKQLNSQSEAPEGLNIDVLRGQWCSLEDLQTLSKEHPEATVKILRRLQWFNAEEAILAWAEAFDFLKGNETIFEERNECFHLEIQLNDATCSAQRVFVVTKKWLSKTQTSIEI